MAYATVIHVLARNVSRGTYTATSVPNATQVSEYLLEAAAEIDNLLLTAGYAAPFDSSIASGAIASTGVLLLQGWNALRAALEVERTSPVSDRVKDFEVMWGEAQKMMVNSDLDFPRNPSKAYPRAPDPVPPLIDPNKRY